MKTLKEARKAQGLRQADIAGKIKKTISDYCNYETGAMIPSVAEMIRLENEFSQKLDWQDKMTPGNKFQIMQSVIILSENYPLPAVFKFVAQALKEPNPGEIINHYVGSIYGEPLLPTDVGKE